MDISEKGENDDDRKENAGNMSSRDQLKKPKTRLLVRLKGRMM